MDMSIEPFGWDNDTAPPISAENLELDRAQIAAYAESVAQEVETVALNAYMSLEEEPFTATGTLTNKTNRIYLFNATGKSFSYKLPANPAAKQYIVLRAIQTNANLVTIEGNGHNIDGSASLLLGPASEEEGSAPNRSVTLVYSAKTGEWNQI